MKSISILAAFTALQLSSSSAHAQTWQQWSVNGHYYLAVHTPAGVTWSQARTQALALGGDLATITSQAENNFVFSLISAGQFWRTANNPPRLLGPWLGGFQPATAPEPTPAANWNWVTGEAWTSPNWSPGEPNNWNGVQEDHLHFFTIQASPAPFWNDLFQTHLLNGFVVETLVPPPVTFCTAGTSGNGCVAMISATTQPTLSNTSLCSVQVSNAAGQRSGLLFYGVDGPIVYPWYGSSSFLCVKSPTQRTTLQSTGGSPGGCDGVLALNWNAYQQSHPGSLGQPWSVGDPVYLQGWYRDPTGGKTTALSNALQLIVQP